MNQKTTTSPEDEYAAAFAEAAAARRGESVRSDPPADGPKGEQDEVKTEQVADPAPNNDPEPTLEQKLEQLRRERDEALHRERSASARVSAFHKKLNAVQSELQALRGQAPAAPAAQNDAPAAGEEDEELKAALSEMPEIAKLVDRLVDRKVSQSVKQVKQEVDQAVTPLRQRAEQDELKSEIAVVEAEFPDWRQTVFSAEWEEWLATKSPVIQQAYGQATTAADALEFLRMYRSEKGSKPAAPAAPAAPAPASPQGKLAKAVGIPSRQQPPVASGAPAADDYEGAFEFFAAQRRRQTA